MSNAVVCTQVLNFKMEKADFSNVAALLHSPSSADAVIRIQSGFALMETQKWPEENMKVRLAALFCSIQAIHSQNLYSVK